eukprot:4317185-Prymnesium_polylepis.3
MPVAKCHPRARPPTLSVSLRDSYALHVRISSAHGGRIRSTRRRRRIPEHLVHKRRDAVGKPHGAERRVVRRLTTPREVPHNAPPLRGERAQQRRVVGPRVAV